jgi:hypothetical protein
MICSSSDGYDLIYVFQSQLFRPCSSVVERVTRIKKFGNDDEAQGSTPCEGTRYSQAPFLSHSRIKYHPGKGIRLY